MPVITALVLAPGQCKNLIGAEGAPPPTHQGYQRRSVTWGSAHQPDGVVIHLEVHSTVLRYYLTVLL